MLALAFDTLVCSGSKVAFAYPKMRLFVCAHTHTHDVPQGGYFGEKRPLDSIQRKYCWQGLPGDVKNFTCH